MTSNRRHMIPAAVLPTVPYQVTDLTLLTRPLGQPFLILVGEHLAFDLKSLTVFAEQGNGIRLDFFEASFEAISFAIGPNEESLLGGGQIHGTSAVEEGLLLFTWVFGIDDGPGIDPGADGLEILFGDGLSFARHEVLITGIEGHFFQETALSGVAGADDIKFPDLEVPDIDKIIECDVALHFMFVGVAFPTMLLHDREDIFHIIDGLGGADGDEADDEEEKRESHKLVRDRSA
jgi:hypothetical protein